MMEKERQILLVEDEPADIDLLRHVLGRVCADVSLRTLGDGENIVEELKSGPRPDLILLDLNMPKRSGTEVLRELKKNAEWRRIPVVILTSSSRQSDICDSYEAGASCFVKKPIGLQETTEFMRRLVDFWFTDAVFCDCVGESQASFV